MISKNAGVDKTGVFQALFQNLVGKAFAFGKTDEKWKINSSWDMFEVEL